MHPAIRARTANFERSGFLDGAIPPRIPNWIPIELIFEKPQSAYVAIICDRACNYSKTSEIGLSNVAILQSHHLSSYYLLLLEVKEIREDKDLLGLGRIRLYTYSQ